MDGRAIPKEDEATLNAIIRSVDKKLDYSAVDHSDAAGPHFTLHLVRESRQGTMNVGVNDLREAKTDLVCRNKIRQKIKSLRDHMWDSELLKDVLGTKAARMLKGAAQNENAFRPRFERRPPRR